MNTPTRADVLACPFCGVQPQPTSEDWCYPQNHARDIWSANCAEIWGGCGAHTLGRTAEEAIAAWNRRTLTSEAEEAEIAELLALDEKRTPGEWYAGGVVRDENDNPFIGISQYESADKPYPHPVEDTICDVYGTEHDHEANAAFIAAAPRMARIIRRLAGRK